MNIPRSEHEARLQALAEQAEREGAGASGDPQMDRYRLVARALRQPLVHDLPVDFTARVLVRIAQMEERAGFEDAVTIMLLLVMAVVGLVVAAPFFGAMASQFHLAMPALPWAQLLASALCIGGFWLLDRKFTPSRPIPA